MHSQEPRALPAAFRRRARHAGRRDRRWNCGCERQTSAGTVWRGRLVASTALMKRYPGRVSTIAPTHCSDLFAIFGAESERHRMPKIREALTEARDAPELVPGLDELHCEVIEAPDAAWDRMTALFSDMCLEQ